MEKRQPIEIVPSGQTYIGSSLNLPNNRRAFLALLYSGIILLCFFLLLGSAWGVGKSRAARSEMTANALQTLSYAQTLTAIPTSTVTPSPTVTSTPTITFTPTITLTPTATPKIAWSNGYSPDNNGRTGAMLSMAIGNNDKIYLAYFEDSNDDLRVAKLVQGGWQVDRLRNIVNFEKGRVGWFPSVKVGSNNVPYLIYYNFFGHTLEYLYQFESGDWSSVKTVAGNITALDTEIALDKNNTAYFGIVDGSKNSVYLIKNTDVNPILEKVDATGSLSDHPNGSQLLGFVQNSASDRSYLVYSTSTGLRFAIKDKKGWQINSIDSNGLYPALAIDKSGGVHLSYYDSNKPALIYGYLPPGKTNWIFSTVDEDGNVGKYPSIFVDGSNRVHILYYDATNLDIKYAVGDRTGWNTYLVTKTKGEAWTNNLVVDSKGIIHIVYFDPSVDKIRYLTGSPRN